MDLGSSDRLASRRDNMKKELIKFVIDHLKTFKSYPLEFEYKNKVYDYKTIMKTVQSDIGESGHLKATQKLTSTTT